MTLKKRHKKFPLTDLKTDFFFFTINRSKPMKGRNAYGTFNNFSLYVFQTVTTRQFDTQAD